MSFKKSIINKVIKAKEIFTSIILKFYSAYTSALKQCLIPQCGKMHKG